ncbi:MAG: 3-deoxy-8-phosphooctulonate synthase [Synergistes jonesii]|uniref:3-deoxy-8-phosphooctulonate synthase n=1 Tax=Synergistes jonesii TaxID=2754 RepID=UPI002A760DBC|nr:3-deoxy-8-phosphooctulonate synthase [Synergistes jonesii]MDY2985253.1 3-deoxy-8-phosphooctulonate synthase [Synergistes jonesii]
MMDVKRVKVRDIEVGGEKLTVAAGPCVLDTFDEALSIAREMKKYCAEFGFNYIFKASFDKANRTSIKSYRGPGLEKGLKWLSEIGKEAGVPVVTDVHEPYQAEIAAKHVDLLQIPAFLCRQTDLLAAASRTGRPLNVKKAQFMAPEDMASVVGKCRESGCCDVILCERGTSFGYHELSVDFRSLPVMRALGCPVMFDATHSVQKPGGMGTCSGGDRAFALPLMRAAVAIGVDALFMEVHPNPERAKCDGPNSIPMADVRGALRQVYEIDKVVRGKIGFADVK